MLICSTCGSSDIKQEASIMLDPNFPYLGKDYTAEWWKDFIWNDFYWCNKCDEETTIHGFQDPPWEKE